MALKRQLMFATLAVAVVCGVQLSRDLWRLVQISQYNKAVQVADFAQAATYNGEYGLFAQAYAAHEQGEYQAARILYGRLEHSDDASLRLAAQFNMGNTYLQQAGEVDIEKESDLALPLIELAKVSYRDVLRDDSQHWDAKFNLELALQLSPDIGAHQLIELEGRRNPIRTMIAIDPENELP